MRTTPPKKTERQIISIPVAVLFCIAMFCLNGCNPSTTEKTTSTDSAATTFPANNRLRDSGKNIVADDVAKNILTDAIPFYYITNKDTNDMFKRLLGKNNKIKKLVFQFSIANNTLEVSAYNANEKGEAFYDFVPFITTGNSGLTIPSKVMLGDQQMFEKKQGVGDLEILRGFVGKPGFEYIYLKPKIVADTIKFDLGYSNSIEKDAAGLVPIKLFTVSSPKPSPPDGAK